MTFEYNYTDGTLKLKTSLDHLISLEDVVSFDVTLESLTRDVAIVQSPPIDYETVIPAVADMYRAELRYEMQNGERINEIEIIFIIPIPTNPTPLQRVILFAANNLNLDLLDLEEKIAIVNFLRS